MNARFGFALAIICASFLAACGGGGGGGGSSLPTAPTTPVPTGQPSATPTPGGQPTAKPTGQPTGQPTATPTPNSHATASPTGQPTATPTPNGHATATPMPTATPATTPTPAAPATVTVTLGAQATSAPIPSGAAMTGTGAFPTGNGTLSITGAVGYPNMANWGNSSTPLANFTLTAQGGAVTLNGLPGFTVSGLSGSGYFVAYYDTSPSYDGSPASAWVSTTLTGASADSKRNVTMPATNSPTISIPANSSIYLTVYIGAYLPPPNPSGCVGVNQQPLLKTRSLVGVHPITPGNAFSYSGALTETIVRSSPCPMPTSTANAQVTVSVSETAAPASAPAGTQSDEHSVETDAFLTSTQTTTTDSYVASNFGSLYDLGDQTVDQGGNTVTTSYASPGLQFAQTPEGVGNNWTNAAPTTVVSHLADGSRYSRTYAPTGTYGETDSLPGGLASSIKENADGSGSYSIGMYDQYGNPVQYPIAVSAPSGNTITMTEGQTNHSVPLWYPLPFTPYNDVTKDMGLQQIDSACGVLPSGFNPTQAEKIVRTTTTVDAILGYIDTRTTTTWDQNSSSSQGPLCVEISDVENFYYDYNLDTTWLVYRTSDGNPIQTNTISEVYKLSSAATANIVRRSADSGRAFRAQIAAGQTGITFTRSVERAQRLATFARALHHGRQGGRR